MKNFIEGIHHVTAISGSAQENVNFYAGVLGLPLVKRTVNFDDPGTYHLYYGDEEGSPGSIMTFFPWAYAKRGRPGAGMVSTTMFDVPQDSLDQWLELISASDASTPSMVRRFDHDVLEFRDPHGLELALVGVRKEGPKLESITSEDKPAIRAFFGVNLLAAKPELTADLLTNVFGYRFESEEGSRMRLRSPAGGAGAVIDLEQRTDVAKTGSGTVHHVAFRARDTEEQLEWREAVMSAGHYVTEVKDRNYFKSIYFREPNGVLFEIATDPPGFAVDEPSDHLGERLMLPPWLESRRPQIEGRLEDLVIPSRPRAVAQ